MTSTTLAALAAQGAPLLAGTMVLLALRRSPRAAAAVAIAGTSVALVASAYLLARNAVPAHAEVAQALWLPVGPGGGGGETGGGLAFGVFLDPLSSTMALVVAAVTLAVMVYSLGYMHGDPGFARYFGFLALFAWAMLGLVLSANLLQTLVFWELVGLASFLLIGFWFDRPAPAAAARKAFIMTRAGDVGFLFGILLLIRELGQVTIPELPAAAASGALSPGFINLTAALLLMGVIGKSAQGPLFTWLPDAMEGPTPVSALLHSATMVAAGVYLVARLHGYLAAAPVVMHALLWLALLTALATATMAMVASDIKRVLAYSTISQLGYMLMALAAGSVAAGFFHLTTHAGFKALLFLSAGIFIHHAHSNEMTDIAAHRPLAQRAGVVGLLAGSAALAGIVPFSGYFSKEAILATLGEKTGGAVLALAYAGAGLTAYYTARMVFLTLVAGGAGGAGAAAQRAATPGPHSASGPARRGAAAMNGTVLFLAALTLVLGYLGPWLWARLQPLERSHEAFEFGAGPRVALALVAVGVWVAWLEFGARRALRAPRIGFVERVSALARFCGDNWFVDRLYRVTVIRWATALSAACQWHDRRVVDGASDGFARGTVSSGRLLALLQGGYVQAYVAVLVGALVVLAVFLARAAA